MEDFKATLTSMKSHADRIRGVITEDMEREMAKPNPNWKDLLEQFTVLSAELHNLIEELHRKDTFHTFAVHPKKTNPQSTATPENLGEGRMGRRRKVPLVLRSKAPPELEERERKLTHEFLSETDESQREGLGERIESFNEMCLQLEDRFNTSRASYSFKIKQEEVQMEDNMLHLNTLIEAIMMGKGMGGSARGTQGQTSFHPPTGTAPRMFSSTLASSNQTCVNSNPTQSKPPFMAGDQQGVSQPQTLVQRPFINVASGPQTSQRGVSAQMYHPTASTVQRPALQGAVQQQQTHGNTHSQVQQFYQVPPQYQQNHRQS